MRYLTMVFGLAQTFLGTDYRSYSQRRQLRRLGRELLNDRLEFGPDQQRATNTGLEDNPNALVRQ